MMASAHPQRGLVWAIVGGVVLLAGIVAVIIGSLSGATGTTIPTDPSSPAASGEPSSTASGTPEPTSSANEYVDPSVVNRGWLPEPITTDRDTYIRAALAAASTFDTQLSTREQWLAFMESWFTPDIRFTSDVDREASMKSMKLEFRQGVAMPEQMWDALAEQKGRVSAEVTGPISTSPVPEDPSGDMTIATADVTLTFAQSSGGSESSYDEVVRVSVQVLCGAESVPTPDSAQQPGDCKVVRYFTEPVES